MQRGLTLSFSAVCIPRLAILPNRCDMAGDGAPPPNLARIVGAASAHVVTAIPLEPATRVLRADPAAQPPGRERLRRVDPEQVQPAIAALGRQLRVREPIGWKFGTAIRQVLAAKDSQAQHLLRRQLRAKLWGELSADRRRPVVHV